MSEYTPDLNREMELPAGWYVVAEARELNPKRPHALRRFGLDWVVWMDQSGNWVMQEDRCPHRSARLSDGKVKNGCIECPFHGFQFNSQGKCNLAPELGRDAPGLKVRTESLVLKEGFLWVNRGMPVGSEIPWFSDLPGSAEGSGDAHLWPQHFTRCVENQLDHTHLPFVHASTIGRGLSPDRKAKTEVFDSLIRVTLGYRPGENSNLEFKFPCIWRLQVQTKMMPLIAFVPVDEGHTLLYLRTYQAFVSVPILRRLIGWVMKFTNRIILKQDFRVVVGQRPGDVRHAGHEQLLQGDEAIRGFRKWWMRGGQ